MASKIDMTTNDPDIGDRPLRRNFNGIVFVGLLAIALLIAAAWFFLRVRSDSVKGPDTKTMVSKCPIAKAA